MLFYGASGHAKAVIESWVAAKGSVDGVFDDNPAVKKILSYPVIGKYNHDLHKELPLIISIGSNQVRKKLAQGIAHSFGNVIHPLSLISNSVSLGRGNAVMGGATINAETKIGNHVIINTSSSIDHDCTLNDFVHVAPGATLCGGVQIGEGSLIGAGATIIQEIKIGRWVTIGAGAVIIDHVPDFAVVVGNPGKVVGENSRKILSA